jgi:hypothetical protein
MQVDTSKDNRCAMVEELLSTQVGQSVHPPNQQGQAQV